MQALFKTNTDSTITLSMSTNHSSQNFGLTILEGMNSSSNSYSHHAPWNQNHDGTLTPYTVGSPATPENNINDYGDVIVTSTREVDSYGINTISFDAEAGQLYTIVVGGYKNGFWGDTTDGYTLQVEASAVPLPAAVWLFGSALAGLGAVRRKPKQA